MRAKDGFFTSGSRYCKYRGLSTTAMKPPPVEMTIMSGKGIYGARQTGALRPLLFLAGWIEGYF
jgi:hypothetical protein